MNEIKKIKNINEIKNFFILEIENNFNDFYEILKLNDYLLLEEIILKNESELLKIILNKLDELNDTEFLKIFLPGFFRNEKILKRQIPGYLMLMTNENTKEVLMTFSSTRNIILQYWNDNINY